MAFHFSIVSTSWIVRILSGHEDSIDRAPGVAHFPGARAVHLPLDCPYVYVP